jgi:hypothetical protein
VEIALDHTDKKYSGWKRVPRGPVSVLVPTRGFQLLPQHFVNARRGKHPLAVAFKESLIRTFELRYCIASQFSELQLNEATYQSLVAFLTTFLSASKSPWKWVAAVQPVSLWWTMTGMIGTGVPVVIFDCVQ